MSHSLLPPDAGDLGTGYYRDGDVEERGDAEANLAAAAAAEEIDIGGVDEEIEQALRVMLSLQHGVGVSTVTQLR